LFDLEELLYLLSLESGHMALGRIIGVVLGVVAASGCLYGASAESDWNDFLHYTAIGRFDLAKGYGEALVAANPDPLKLLELSEANPQGYALLLKLCSSKNELTDVSQKILGIIEQGRFIRRTDPKIINAEIKRLSGTVRGRITAVERLKNAGEYAVPYMIDALQDPARKDEMPNIVWALPHLGKDAIRPLIEALQIKDVGIRTEIIRALGEMGYPESLGYLKYIMERNSSEAIGKVAKTAIEKIDPSALSVPAGELFYRLGQSYYDHAPSLAPPVDANFANMWFWDANSSTLTRQKVDKAYFNELMAMRSCEMALKADPNIGKAIGLWIGAFFKAESAGIPMPEYFGPNHADAMTYATTAGPQYLHEALERALKHKEAYVALHVVEALGLSAGEKSLMYRLGTRQPLMDALSFDDRAVRYSAAIAIGSAEPSEKFPERDLVVELLAEALQADANDMTAELTDIYAKRSADVMLKLALSRNKALNLGIAQPIIIKVANDGKRGELQVTSLRVLAYIGSPDAQRAIAAVGLDQQQTMPVRLAAMASLAESAKLNANLLDDATVNELYAIVSSTQAPAELRSAVAAAYGSLNLPSCKVKDLILSQAHD
jgi:HEAT repeat protein